MGMICVEYRAHIKPVAAKARNKDIHFVLPVDWVRDSFSAGLLRSEIPAMTSAHFMAGAQK